MDSITPHFLNITGNAEVYSKQFLRQMFYEYKNTYDKNIATQRDCYMTPQYRLLSPPFNRIFDLPNIFTLIEYIFCGQFSGQISGVRAPTVQEIKLMDAIRQENNQFILIRGAPGMGKTSLFYKFAYEKASTNYCKSYKFIGIKMRELAAYGPISAQFPLTPIMNYLKCDRITLENSILFLDGLDELLSMKDIANHRNEFVKNLFAYIEQMKNCKLIITTRPSVEINFSTPKILTLELLPLSFAQQQKFCDKYTCVHPKARDYAKELLAKRLQPLEIPMALYICLALQIELTDISGNTMGELLEQLFLQIEERNYDDSLTYLGNIIEPRFIAQEIAFAMTSAGNDILENEKTFRILENYYKNTNNPDLFSVAKSIYGLTFYYVNRSSATEFLHKSFAEFLAAEKIEKEVRFLLNSNDESTKNLEKWYELFSSFEISEPILQFYAFKVGKNKKSHLQLLKSMERFMNALLVENRLHDLSDFNREKVDIYIRNILRLRERYLGFFIGCTIDINTENFITCLSVCNTKGIMTNRLPLIKMSFKTDIRYISVCSSIWQDCSFEDIQISSCQLVNKYVNTTFEKVIFTQNSFSKASFDNCKFSSCRFIGNDFFYSTFSNCIFRQTKFIECYMGEANVVATSFQFCEFKDSILQSVSFHTVSNCIFSNVDITAANFQGTDLRTSTLHSLHMRGIVGPGLKEPGCLSEEVFSGSSILLSQLKYIYQFIDSITDISIFDDQQPTKEVSPVVADSEFRFYLGLPISKETLKIIAATCNWPDGIQIEDDFLPRWPYL